MSAAANRFEGDDDEFDSLFDDQQFLDPELEESLAQAEATYSASQAIQQPSTSYSAAPASHSSFRLNTEPASRSAIRRGTFVQPAAKKQRLNPGPSHLSRVTAPTQTREPEVDQVIVRDLRDQEYGENDDEQWWAGNNALDQVEEEAIRMSQQMPSSQPQASTSNHNNDLGRQALHQRQNSANASLKPPNTRQIPSSNNATIGHNAAGTDELAQLRAEVERLRSAQRAQEEMVDKLKQEAYRKSGEVAVVRQNLTKLNQENSQLREREVAREQEHKNALDRLRKEQEQRLQRLETETAFRRVEQDTSRRIWPSSVARLPPVGLNSTTDRRQESQVRAGLTTPTKASRYGVRGSGASSGNRHRYADSNVNREEPATPSRSTGKSGAKFPKPPTMASSTSKSKAFKGLQNSFADFGPVQEKLRQQQERTSPVKTGVNNQTKKGRALAPADWDAEQSYTAAATYQDDVVMTDDHATSHEVHKSLSGRDAPDSRDPELVRAKQKEHNYLAAVSEILHRRTTIVSLLLSHASPKASAPESYPSNRFNPTSSHPHASPSNTDASSSTLSRLISANLVSDCPKLLVFRYRRAVESLLTNLSRAKVLEPEERDDALQLLSVDADEHSVEELDFSSATTHLSHAIASSLMVMAGVLLRLCQTDLLVDVLRLVSCLMGVLPRFWLDMECLQPDAGAKKDEVDFLDGDEEGRWGGWATPIQIREILVQCVDDCRPPYSDAETGGDGGQKAGFGDWRLSAEAREDLLGATVSVLEAMSQCPDASLTSSHHPLRLLARPGILHKLLHPDRPSHIISSIVRMLSSAVSNAPLVHECLASKADPSSSTRSSNHGARANARFPVLELLVKHLVDRRFDLPEAEWHPLHCSILTFLTQSALKSADTLVVLADSAALLAAMIRCLSLDADFVWLQSRPSFLLPARYPTYKVATEKNVDETGGDLVQATERIVMDTRLLNLLYNYPLPLASDRRFEAESTSTGGDERMPPISLASKLDQPETYSMLNGIRQSFVVAVSRVAFCSEPDWIATERKLLASVLSDLNAKAIDSRSEEEKDLAKEIEEEIKGLDRVSMLLEAIADVAGDLADIVLSPEEIDSVYDLLASEEDDVEEMEVDDEVLHPHPAAGVREGRREEERTESETESEPELDTASPKRKEKGKSVSPAKSKVGANEAVDVIVVDDSD